MCRAFRLCLRITPNNMAGRIPEPGRSAKVTTVCRPLYRARTNPKRLSSTFELPVDCDYLTNNGVHDGVGRGDEQAGSRGRRPGTSGRRPICPTLLVPRRREMNFVALWRWEKKSGNRGKEEGRRPWLAGDGFHFVDYQFQGPRLYLDGFVQKHCFSQSSSIGPSTWIILDHWIFPSLGSVVFQIPWHLEAT